MQSSLFIIEAFDSCVREKVRAHYAWERSYIEVTVSRHHSPVCGRTDDPSSSMAWSDFYALSRPEDSMVVIERRQLLKGGEKNSSFHDKKRVNLLL